MNSKTTALLLSGLLFACAQTQPPQEAAPSAPSPPAASAQPSAAESASTDHIVNIRRASCQDLLRLAPEDRAAATMFYIGYQASRLRASTINVGVIPVSRRKPSLTAKRTLTGRLPRRSHKPTHEPDDDVAPSPLRRQDAESRTPE